ncbi:MAG: hypothetical protein QW667_00105 [Candidatus Bathyarchaeia archaeon]
MAEPAKARRLIKLKCWFEESWKKLLAVGFFTFGVLSAVALTKGVGYEATAKVTSIEIIRSGHPCYGYVVTGNLTCTFNPFLYPVTHIFGYENNSVFQGVSEPHDSEGKSVKEAVETLVAFKEFPKNIPFYISISFAVAFGSVKLIEELGRCTKILLRNKLVGTA